MQINAQQFDRIARSVFAPVYPVIAEQIISHTGVTHGVCLDIGCGGGYLGAALARTSDLFIRFFDQSADMLKIVEETIAENGLEQRAAMLQGDVSAVDLPDNSIDLAVSRGSAFFWEDLGRAFQEIYRVLAPNGWAYIGGGFGSKQLKEVIEREMQSRDKGGDKFKNKVRRNLSSANRDRFQTALQTAGIDSGSIIFDDEIGLWAVMQK